MAPARRQRPRLLPATLLVVLLAAVSAASASAGGASNAAAADAVFDALDLDGDGVLHREDVRDGLERVGLALGLDLDAVGAAAGAAAGAGGAASAGRRAAGVDGAVVEGIGGGAGADASGEAAAAAAKPQEKLTVPQPPNAAASAEGRRRFGKTAAERAAEREKLSFWKAFTSSVAMIIATEIGDKTFFIAAVLSMRNARGAVFGGAILALIIMTILSTMMGLILPSFLPRRYTHIIGGLLFLYFGIRLVLESRGMEEDKVSDELEEVEEELMLAAASKKKKDVVGGGGSKKEKDEDDDLEGGGKGGGGVTRRGNSTVGSAPTSGNNATTGSGNLRKQESSGMSSAAGYTSSSFRKVFLQSLTLTFLAEWGDRSQIATIALAAAKDPYGVTVGGCLGHSLCTGMACVGGRMLASRISEKTVTFWGGIVFNIFGIHSLFFET